MRPLERALSARPETRVLDAQGAPLVVFHGTSSEFEEFAANPRGIFFSQDPTRAESFARIRAGRPRLIEAHLDIRNPWTVIRYTPTTPYSTMVDQSVEALRARGFDGMHDPQEGTWIAFDASQVSILGEREVEVEESWRPLWPAFRA